MLKPKLDILPPEQKNVWPKLIEIPEIFVLYGGTAIALRLGHRESVDFDFFTHKNFDPEDLFNKIPFLKDAQITHQAPSTISVELQQSGFENSVKFSFFGVNLPQIKEPEIVKENGIKVASLIDLFGMKCATIYQRAEKKDYIDVDAILSSGVDINRGVTAARTIYGEQYNSSATQKALSYTKDIKGLSPSLAKRLATASIEVDLKSTRTLQIIGPIGKSIDIDHGLGLRM